MTEWNKILYERCYSREEPDEIAVDFAKILMKKNKPIRVLDLGCGAGRHLILMAKYGFESHGADTSQTGLNMTNSRLKSQKLNAHLVKCDMKNLPYKASSFDAVLCLHAIYHQKLRQIQQTISEIQRVMKKEGLILINFLSRRTYSYGKGTELEKDTFMEECGTEKGVLHHYSDEEEVQKLLRKFRILDLNLEERTVDGKLRSRLVVLAME